MMHRRRGEAQGSRKATVIMTQLRRLRMEENLIQSDPAVMMGKPVIKGSRITVELILEKLAVGETVEEILRSYPHLKKEGVLAAVAYKYISI
jgi:uncharacterized protein (DUF433 family)